MLKVVVVVVVVVAAAVGEQRWTGRCLCPSRSAPTSSSIGTCWLLLLLSTAQYMLYAVYEFESSFQVSRLRILLLRSLCLFICLFFVCLFTFSFSSTFPTCRTCGRCVVVVALAVAVFVFVVFCSIDAHMLIKLISFLIIQDFFVQLFRTIYL